MEQGNPGRRSWRAGTKLLSTPTDIAAAPRRPRTLPDATGSCLPGLVAVLAVLAVQPATAADLTGAAGADGAGFAGTVGDAGGTGGSALEVTAGTAFTNALGSTLTGGDGGDGRSLVGADAQSRTSSTLGIDSTIPLAGQAGIAAGDSFDVRVNGVNTTVTVNASERLNDVAAEIDALAGVSSSATTTGSNDVLTISQDTTVIDRIQLFNNNNTPLTALGISSTTINPLFEDGGAGITLSAGSSGQIENAGTAVGAGLELRSGSSVVVRNTGTIRGGVGGTGGSGGVGGGDGTVGQGGAGVVMAGNGQTLVNGGQIVGGLDGNGAVRASAVTITGNDNRLELQAGGSFEGEVVATGTDNAFLLGGSSTGTFDNGALGSSLQGFASFQKTGTGTWSLAGSDSQAWTVTQGTLLVAGSVGSATVTGGRIGGTGTLGSLTLGSGRLAPGNSVGTLNVTGNVSFGPGSVYEVEVDGSRADRLAVGGTAALDGRVSVISLKADGDRSVLGDYLILSAAGGVTGTFDGVEANYAFLLPSLSCANGDVILTLAKRELDFQDLLGPFAHSRNAQRFVASLGGIDTGAAGYQAFENALLLLQSGQEAAAVEGLSGSGIAATDGAIAQMADSFLASIRARIYGRSGMGPDGTGRAETGQAAEAGVPREVQVASLDPAAALDPAPGQDARAHARARERVAGAVSWAQVVGSRSDLEDSGDLPGFGARSAGLHLGAEATLREGFLLGMALGYERGRLEAEDLASSDFEAYSAGLYARQSWAALRLSGAATYTRLTLDGSRSVTGFGTQTAGYEAAVWAVDTEVAYDLALSEAATLTPLAGLRYTHGSRDAYSETGLAGLEVGSLDEGSLRGRLGAELSLELERATFHTRVAWSHELADPDGTTEAALLGGPTYTIEGQRLPADLAEIGLGLAWAPWDDVDVFAAYEGAFSTGYASHAGQLGVRYSW